MLRIRFLLPFLFLWIFLSGWSCRSGDEGGSWLLVHGGTLLDVSKLGHGGNDMEDAWVLIHGDTIAAVGQGAPPPSLPRGTRTVDAGGGYLVPGLIDGFGVLNNQAYAQAYLYMGVTTLVEVDGGRRGPFFPGASPAPDIFRLEGLGERPAPTQVCLDSLRRLHDAGYRVVLLMYGLGPGQLDTLVREAHALGMNCIAELGHTTYHEAMAAGVEAFVHFTRYSLELAPRAMAAAVADRPFSDELDSPKWRYYRWLSALDPADPRVAAYGRDLAASHTFLQPTLSLLYLDLPEHRNPWHFPVAALLDPADVNDPADPQTGRHDRPAALQEAYAALARQQMRLERVYHAAGARYLAGSATDVWGTLPGISLHTELELLHRAGLSRREALATATGNFHEAYGWRRGLLRPGYRASLLVLEANPLDDLDHLQKIRTLILNGQVLDREALLTPPARGKR